MVRGAELNLRAGLMPPARKPRPAKEEKERIENWIKTAIFEIDPADPDPGRVTVRRLNRVEYHNTIRDLLGVEYNAGVEFPPDDTGYGFDNIGDVLTLSPMLLEKYLAAARTIVTEAVSPAPKVPEENRVAGNRFSRADAADQKVPGGGEKNPGAPLLLSYYEPATVFTAFNAEHPGSYQLVLELTIKGNSGEFGFDSNKCQVVFKVDDRELLKMEYGWHEKKDLRFDFDEHWGAGEHRIAFELLPLTAEAKKNSSLEMRLNSVTVRGPREEKYWVRPANYGRFFTREAPQEPHERRAYARDLLGNFAAKAFRRPANDSTLDRLVALAEEIYRQPGKTFESGVAHAMIAVLASPRFLFREEGSEPQPAGLAHPFVDEYALASRLSYLLWSSMPDEELFQLAGEKQLRSQLNAQVKRMLADRRSEALIQNFTGQWLQARDIETAVIDARAILAREEKADPEMERLRKRFQELRDKPDESLTSAEKEELTKARTRLFRPAGRARAELSGELRQAMCRETEMCVEYIARNDRSLL